MSPHVQSLLALGIVAAAAVWLAVRALRRRSKPGCGGGCGCPGSELKAHLARDDRR